jgi:hypothetical protein
MSFPKTSITVYTNSATVTYFSPPMLIEASGSG